MTRSYFRHIFRLVFVLFSLYLIKDAFFRWDGFRYYASFSEFLPSVALVSILWTCIAVFIASIILICVKLSERLFLFKYWILKIEYVLFFIISFVLFIVAFWKIRPFVYASPMSLSMKLFVIFGIIIISIVNSYIFRDKAESWMGIINDRLTPMVWLFSVWLIFSVLLVAYLAIDNQSDYMAAKNVDKAYISDVKRPNIILVTFDTLAAQNMSVYGYNKQTTPFISKWAGNASLFKRLEAESNFTTPTVASMMTGKRLWTHQTYHLDGSKPKNSDQESLPFILKNNGYYNMAFVQNHHASVRILGLSRSFDIAPLTSEFVNAEYPLIGDKKFGYIDVFLYRFFGGKIRLHDWIIDSTFILGRLLRGIAVDIYDISTTPVPPEIVFNRFFDTIEKGIPEPYFAWIHIHPTHDPYLPPEPFMGMFNSSEKMRTIGEQFEIFLTLNFPPEAQPTINIVRDRYDEFIRYCDNQFQQFIEQLDIRDTLENTVIVLSADHGESFEHNYFTHGGRQMFEQVTHIPLIIKEPGQIEGRTIYETVEQIDIPATILDLSGISVPSWMEGRSLLPLIKGDKIPSRPAFSMTYQENPSRNHKIEKGSIAVWDGDYKLISFMYPNKNYSVLFNLKDDPGELKDLSNDQPVIKERLIRLIQNNLELANERIAKKQ